jgi:hypothetical protein
MRRDTNKVMVGLLLTALLLVSAGCYHSIVDTGLEPGPTAYHEGWETASVRWSLGQSGDPAEFSERPGIVLDPRHLRTSRGRDRVCCRSGGGELGNLAGGWGVTTSPNGMWPSGGRSRQTTALARVWAAGTSLVECRGWRRPSLMSGVRTQLSLSG